MIKKIVTITVFLILSNIIHCQDESNRFGIGFNFTPNVAYRAILFDDIWTDEVKTNLRNTLHGWDHSSLRFSYGIPCYVRIADKISLESRVYFSQRGYGRIRNSDLPDTITMNLDLVHKSTSGQSWYSYFDIPIMLRYYIVQKGSISIYSKVGASLNCLVLVKHKSHTESYGDFEHNFSEIFHLKDLFDEGYRRINLSSIVAVGASVKINQKLYLQIEPIWNFMITHLFNEKSSREFHHYEVGLRTGIIYTL